MRIPLTISDIHKLSRYDNASVAHFSRILSSAIGKCAIIHLPDQEAGVIYGSYGLSKHVVKSAVSHEGVGKRAMTRERLNRLWARPFGSSSSCNPSWTMV